MQSLSLAVKQVNPGARRGEVYSLQAEACGYVDGRGSSRSLKSSTNIRGSGPERTEKTVVDWPIFLASRDLSIFEEWEGIFKSAR